MSILDKILKKKEKNKHKEELQKKDAKPLLAIESAKAEPSLKKIDKSSVFILRSHITEKSSLGQEHNAYTFVISEDANKVGVKRAISEMYGVKVEYVKIVNLPDKKRSRGAQFGWKRGLRKAVVKVAEGQKITLE